MEANKAPKSKFVYPDKLYARCGDNKTLDIYYAPQNMEAVEYTRKDAFIENAAIWFNNNFIVHDEYGVISESFDTKEEMFENFVKFMEGE